MSDGTGADFHTLLTSGDEGDGVASAARSVADAASPALPRDARRSGSGASRAGAASQDFVRPSTPHVLTSWRLSTRSSRPTPQADPGGPGRRHTLGPVGRSGSSTLPTSRRRGQQVQLGCPRRPTSARCASPAASRPRPSRIAGRLCIADNPGKRRTRLRRRDYGSGVVVVLLVVIVVQPPQTFPAPHSRAAASPLA